MQQKPLRILHVIPSLCLIHGGPSIAMRTMARSLERASDILIEIATTDDDGPGRRLTPSPGSIVLDEGVCYRFFPKNTEFYKFSFGFLCWILKSINSYDLIHIHGIFSFVSTFTALVARSAGVPYVIQPLGALCTYGRKNRRRAIKALSIQFLEGPLLKGASAVHFASEKEAEEAQDAQLDVKAVIIPIAAPPLEVSDFSSPPEKSLDLHRFKDATRIVFLSRLDPVKNIESLLDALALLRRGGGNFILLIGGSGSPSYEVKLRARAEFLGVCESTVWLGDVRGQSKAALLSVGHIFAQPSYSESFGIALVEALSCGLPCVVSEGVALSQQVVAAGAGVSVGTSPAAIAEGIQALSAVPAHLTSASHAARALAEREFSLHAMGQRLVTLYKSILQDGRRPRDRKAT